MAALAGYTKISLNALNLDIGIKEKLEINMLTAYYGQYNICRLHSQGGKLNTFIFPPPL